MKTRRASNRWSGSYDGYGSVPVSVIKEMLQHMDANNANAWVAETWSHNYCKAALLVCCGATPETPFKYRSDIHREMDSLKSEYLRRSQLAGVPLLSKPKTAIMQEAVDKLKTLVTRTYKVSSMPWGGEQRYIVCDGTESKWLPAGEWKVEEYMPGGAQGGTRHYAMEVHNRAPSLWLDEYFGHQPQSMSANFCLLTALQYELGLPSPQTPMRDSMHGRTDTSPLPSTPGSVSTASGAPVTPTTIMTTLQKLTPEAPERFDASIHTGKDGNKFVYSKSRQTSKWLTKEIPGNAIVCKDSLGNEYIAPESGPGKSVFVDDFLSEPIEPAVPHCPETLPPALHSPPLPAAALEGPQPPVPPGSLLHSEASQEVEDGAMGPPPSSCGPPAPPESPPCEHDEVS